MDFPGYPEKLSAVLPRWLATSIALAGYRANVRLFDRLCQATSARDGFVRRRRLEGMEFDTRPHPRPAFASPKGPGHV
jgi:hypothetical protein